MQRELVEQASIAGRGSEGVADPPLGEDLAVVPRELAAPIDLPQDAFVPWEKDAIICYRRGAEETAEHIVVPGVDEYQLMVEHFADLVLSGVKPLVPLEDSIHNLAVLDALGEAAKNGGSVAVERGSTRPSGMS